MSTFWIKKLLEIPSPTGYTQCIIDFIESELKSSKLYIQKTYKGSLLCAVDPNPELLFMSHIDTLGAMVKQINPDGTLEISQLGGYPPESFEGEYCTIISPSGPNRRGTFLIKNPAAHVNNKISSTQRKMHNMCVRLDEEVENDKDVRNLGLGAGDFVAFDTRTELTESGFLKSRFIDDKACSGILMDILQTETSLLKKRKVGFFFSNYEEVGHACPAGIPNSVKDVIIADMGVVGNGVGGCETKVSICAKDSAGPYDYEIRKKLTDLAEKNKIPYVVDIFPFYASDGSALWKSGKDVRIGLIGPGVSASHGVERTHEKGIGATRDLIVKFINDYFRS